MSIKRGARLAIIAAGLGVALSATAPAPAGTVNTQLSAQLKGGAEVPGPGDRNGKGEAFAAVKLAKRKLCWQVSWVRIAEPAAAHIHKGAKGDAGPVKVTLFDQPQPSEIAEGCARKVKRKLLRRIAASPEKFYVNVHNAEFPDGAIRGQLGPAL